MAELRDPAANLALLITSASPHIGALQVYAPPDTRPVAGFDMLHLPVFSDVDPAAQRRLQNAGRLSGFDEVLAGLSEPAARHEAQRCLSCGVCFECDNCFGACPEQAIIKLNPGYSLNESLCTGCATCFEQCPCHAIQMVAETEAAGG